MRTYEAWSADRATEIIASHRNPKGATLLFLHDLQVTFGRVTEVKGTAAQVMSANGPTKRQERHDASTRARQWVAPMVEAVE